MPEHQHTCQHDHGLGIVKEDIQISVTGKHGTASSSSYERAKTKNKDSYTKVAKPHS